jgi:hypothetical protein
MLTGLGALLSFLGGSTFRMVWGEISSYFTRKQEHAQQLDMMKLQETLEAGRHERDMARIRLQSDLKVQEVKVVGDVAIQGKEADAFVEAIKAAAKPIGIFFVDAWNGSIRPAMATVALGLWVLALYRAGFVPSEWDKELIAGILGFYIADRTLAKRGK